MPQVCAAARKVSLAISSAVSICSNPKCLQSTEMILRYSVRNRCGIRFCSSIFKRLSFINLADFHRIPFALQDGAALGKCYRFFDGLRFDDDVAADGLLDLAKRPVCHDAFVPDHMRVIEQETVLADEFVLGCDTADPVHGLLHPGLQLFRGGYLGAVFVPEDQHKFIHDCAFYLKQMKSD